MHYQPSTRRLDDSPWSSLAVVAARQMLAVAPCSNDPLPAKGLESLRVGSQQLIFGHSSSLLHQRCVATVQTLGFYGALDLAMRYLSSSRNRQILVPSPYGPVARICQSYGFQVTPYSNLASAVSTASRDSIIVIDAIIDAMQSEDWLPIGHTMRSKNMTPILDASLQGCIDGDLVGDAAAIRVLAELCDLPIIVLQAFDVSMMMGHGRLGALHVVVPPGQSASAVEDRLELLVEKQGDRTDALIASMILQSPVLLQQWQLDLVELGRRVSMLSSTPVCV